jgi:4,5-dihydroxyphthalate decarboxylase
MSGKVKLLTLLGSYPNTLPIKEGKVPSDLADFEFADFKVANKGFKPLVREAKFDLGELAIATFCRPRPTISPMS